MNNLNSGGNFVSGLSARPGTAEVGHVKILSRGDADSLAIVRRGIVDLFHIGTLAILSIALTGCTIAPHGSHATHRIWTYQGRSDGLIRYEVMTDRSAGGGGQFGTFTSLDNLVVVHTNSTMQLGGTLTIGQAYIGTDTNLARNITALGDAAGTAAGAALGAAVHKAVGLP